MSLCGLARRFCAGELSARLGSTFQTSLDSLSHPLSMGLCERRCDVIGARG